MDSSPSKSAESSSWRQKSAGGASSSLFRAKHVSSSSSSSSEQNWRKPKLAVAVASANVPNLRPGITKPAKVFHHGVVLNVNYEKCFGFIEGETSTSNVYFRLPPPGDPTTGSTLTGGIRLIPGDVMEYELATNSARPQAYVAKLRECKRRNVNELDSYVASLVTAAKQHGLEKVLRVITKCSVAFMLVLNYDRPSHELIRRTLELCQILSSSSQLYHSRLKQMYSLFNGSPFLTSERGVRTWAKYLSSSSEHSELLRGFLVSLLEFTPSQLAVLSPLILTPRNSDAIAKLFNDFEKVLPLLHAEGKSFLETALEALILADEAETFSRKILVVLAGGSSSSNEVPWSQLPLLPTLEEVRCSGSRSALPVVKRKGPYSSPEEYLDTYLRLLREDCFAGLLQGIRALCQGKAQDCDLKLWLNVSACGVHFDYNASPGLTLAVMLPTKNSKAPLGGSLVCFFDDGGGFESPIWGVVSRCEEETVNTCTVCFVDITVLKIGAETSESNNENSWCFQFARLMQGEDLVMAESPTYYKAYQPVLETLQLTNPESVPFREELVSVTWPEDPAPEYLKSATATLDWSCIFKVDNAGTLQQLQTRGDGDSDSESEVFIRGGAIREGVGAVTSLMERGYKTSFDHSQLKAVELAVHNRLCMIQGPPGTGKTHVGVKLLQLLLSASTFPEDSPVFVITLKNHALDQFLERCLDFEHEIVRVGGRSKSQKLESHNLHRMVQREEFRCEYVENIQKLSALKEDMEAVFGIVNQYVAEFDFSMILEHAPDLHMHHFLERAVPAARIESCAKKLPEGVTLVELLRIPRDADPTLVADVLYFRNSMVAVMERWMPKPEVLQSALAFLSLKKPVSSRILQRHHVNEKSVLPDEEDERRKEEEERTAYESLRQFINLESDAESTAKTSNQWLLGNDFVRFSKRKDNSMTYHRFNFLIMILTSLVEPNDQCISWIELEASSIGLHMKIRMTYWWSIVQFWCTNTGKESVNRACERLTRMKAEYDILMRVTEQIKERQRLDVLRNAKIIGMTTTGAAIHQNVVKHLSPAVVFVEEAAEILEPQVLASLNPKLQHLILIGDHQQLRPQVESYNLERWHGFGCSMFERLVEHNNLPHQQLSLQCRMREEFVPMIQPIYPSLKSHSELVSGRRNEAPTCMVKTMYFWSHLYPETSQRSCVNQDEARMVVALTRWIASELPNPESLKILAAYNGQVTLIRNLMGKYPELGKVEVRSIDSFQGAESEIVIVSLVRSNEEGNIGHLSMRNRLCVAASRARRGVYFIGNHTTLAKKSLDWRTLINHFENVHSLDTSVPLCCPRHPERPPFPLCNSAASQFKPRDVCGYPCQQVLPCGHVCTRTCHFGAHISHCKEPVDFTFRVCGHSGTKMCCDNVSDLVCKRKVIHTFTDCEHNTEKECWEVSGSKKRRLKCQVVCGKELDKCGHMCKLHCSETCGSAPCEDCLELENEKEKIRNQILLKAIDSKRKELEEEILKLKGKGNEGIVVKQVYPEDDTTQSYFMAKDRAEKYTLPDSKTMVVVTEVQKIENLALQAKFLKAQRDLFDPLEIPAWLFYGGSDDLLDQVVDKGFRAARGKAHRFDVYSSSIAQEHGNSKLLICEVHLGKTWRLESLDVKLDGKALRVKQCDSVSLVGGQENEEEPRPFAHVIFNPGQAIPRFMVSYNSFAKVNNEFERFGEEQALINGGVCRLPLLPSLHYQGLTPEDYHFRLAESQFFRMSVNRKMKVTKVELIKNLNLEERFNRTKAEFKTSNVKAEQRFVFHGTDSAAIDKIATEGFKVGGTEGVAIKFGAAYGRGVYTATNPDTSLAYCRDSNMMLLSIAIPGELNKHHNIGGSRDVLVIKDARQLLPKYVVYYSSNAGTLV